MDNSDETFRAAKRTVELVKDQNFLEKKSQMIKQEVNIKDKNYPEIIIFHSIEHRKLSDKIALYIPSSFGANYSIPTVDYHKLQEEYKVFGRKILEKTREIFDKNGINIEPRLITDEKPEDYIEKVVEEENIDLIVLGSKGEHSKLEQIFSGTVAQKVVNEVPCDVLVVR
jgi:nucleotide-binding universal stress UspA family protein